jgi:cytochrome oxidase Cu insertion factor (SCO1/SenC/PrrC family)
MKFGVHSSYNKEMQNNSLLPSRQKLIFASVMLVLALIISAIGLSLNTTATHSSGTALIGGPFHMVNHKGEAVTEKSYAGQYMLLFFGFTSCKDVCPTELQVMTAALQELGTDAEKITPLFVTVDPDRDTVDVMKTYVSAFHPRLQGLTGTAVEVAEIAKAYHIFYAKVPNPNDPTDYEMDHASIIYLMGPDGTFLKHFTYTTDAKALAEGLKKVLHS